MQVAAIPMPGARLLGRVRPLREFLSPDTIGITFGYGVFIRREYWCDRALLVHELVHVAQYERFGSTEAFLRAYLHECFTVGYAHAPLEREASTRAAEICATGHRPE
jgi:hypothetical protein